MSNLAAAKAVFHQHAQERLTRDWDNFESISGGSLDKKLTGDAMFRNSVFRVAMSFDKEDKEIKNQLTIQLLKAIQENGFAVTAAGKDSVTLKNHVLKNDHANLLCHAIYCINKTEIEKFIATTLKTVHESEKLNFETEIKEKFNLIMVTKFDINENNPLGMAFVSMNNKAIDMYRNQACYSARFFIFMASFSLNFALNP